MRPTSRFTVLALTSLLTAASAHAAAPSTPDFGPNVLVFDADTDDLQKQVDDVFKKQESNQFGPDRYALLFKPGSYKAKVNVGFYTSVLGLGSSPDDVTITGEVSVNANWLPPHNATCNFWRCAENLAIRPTGNNHTDMWAVSQGVDLRRVHVRGNLTLFDSGGWSSGGFLADSRIDGTIESGSQQQWFSRNTDWGHWDGGVWNMVFVGDDPTPQGHWPTKPYTVIDTTPVIREKPYLTIDRDMHYQVMAPALLTDSRGRSWHEPAKAIPIEQFFIAHADRDNAATLNAALANGQNLLFTPGIYHLEDVIHVTKPDTIVLGLGYATVIPDKGTPAIAVDDVDGVSIAGLILDAGAMNSPSLLQVGPTDGTADHTKDPTVLYDIVARSGGATAGKADTFVTINSNHVIGDNLWLWRADHGEGAGWDTNPAQHSLVVNGDNVTCYGLFCEHTEGYQTLWNGNGGRTYFYQSEIPYDVPSQSAWTPPDGKRGFASYKVADTVKTHQAFGLGVYSNFTAAPVILDDAIEAPDVPGVDIQHMTTIRLSGLTGSGIAHIRNGHGDPVIKQFQAKMDYRPAPASPFSPRACPRLGAACRAPRRASPPAKHRIA